MRAAETWRRAGRGQESLGAAARATTTNNDNKNNDNMGKGASGSVIYIKSEEQFNELINAGKPGRKDAPGRDLGN